MTERWLDELTCAVARGAARLPWLRPAMEHMRKTMLMTHRKLRDVIRDTRKTMYVVAAFYVGVGFLVAIASLASGTLLGTFLGFLIVSGTLAVATVLRAVLRTDLHISGIHDALVRQHDRLDRIEHAIVRTHDATARETAPRADGDRVVDLGTGEACPDRITAATLHRDAFPRLASLMDREAPASRFGSAAHANVEASGLVTPPRAEPSNVRGDDEDFSLAPRVESVTFRNVHRTWKRALREGDLVSARRAYAALLEACDPASVDAMRTELAELTRRTERSLRRAVGECLAHRDVDGLIALMEEIRRQLPEHPMAGECARLEPALRRHAGAETCTDRARHNAPSDLLDDQTPASSRVPARLCVARSVR